jgi:hypothetical protein
MHPRVNFFQRWMHLCKSIEVVMVFLHELASIKERDQRYENGSQSETDVAKFEARQARRRAICDQIRTLGVSVA